MANTKKFLSSEGEGILFLIFAGLVVGWLIAHILDPASFPIMSIQIALGQSWVMTPEQVQTERREAYEFFFVTLAPFYSIVGFPGMLLLGLVALAKRFGA